MSKENEDKINLAQNYISSANCFLTGLISIDRENSRDIHDIRDGLRVAERMIIDVFQDMSK